jgi:ABC-2 type transport system ATP-binding protein
MSGVTLAAAWPIVGLQAAAALALLAAGALPEREPALSWQLAALCGALAGLGLVVVLAGLRLPWRTPSGDEATLAPGPPCGAEGRRRLRPASLLGAGALLLLTSASEEVIWRGLVLSVLSEPLGTAGAYAVSTAGFALAHREPRSVCVHLVTGAAFGGVYLATGSLLAAIVAHGLYNLSVLLAVASAWRLHPASAGFRLEPSSSHVVVARGVVKRYRTTEALRGFDLDVRAGEVVALLGPNGAGKTTAVQVMLGLRRPDAGEVTVLGAPPGSLGVRRRVGVTLQEMGAPELLRVGEVLSFVRAHYPAPRPFDELLERFGLSGLVRRQVGGLSGGERRRLALALAFAGDPELVFLDEPTTGLDVESRLQVWAALRAFASAKGTILLTTHYLEEAEALATRVAVMRAGRVIRVGPAPEIKRELGTDKLEDAFLLLTGDEG